MKSSGFIKPQEKPECESIEHLSKEVQELIQEMLPYYKAMYSERVQLAVQ